MNEIGFTPPIDGLNQAAWYKVFEFQKKINSDFNIDCENQLLVENKSRSIPMVSIGWLKKETK